jgi:hypothetical protein
MARNDAHSAIIFGSAKDVSRAEALAEVLRQHDIEVHPLSQDHKLNGKKYAEGASYLVPLDQYQYRLIDIMFETVTDFKDSLFYDVSTWTLPLAFNLNFDFLDDKQLAYIRTGTINPETLDLGRSEYAYAFKWDDYFAPALLWKIQSVDLRTRLATKSFEADGERFDAGTIVIPVQNQVLESELLHEFLTSASQETGLKIFPLSTGFTEDVNLGSPSMEALQKPEIAILVENGVRSYDAGEVWHLLDHRFGIAHTMLPVRELNSADLDRYNLLVMVDGYYGSLSERAAQKIKDWLNQGGNLIALKSANRWLTSQNIISLDFASNPEVEIDQRPYETLPRFRGAQATGGSIFSASLDLSHPLAYGYENNRLPVFVNSNLYFEPPKNPYAYPLQFTNDPLMSGYLSEENLERIKETAGMVLSRVGSGKVISFSFNPNFRAFWYGTNKLFLNSIFFADEISSAAASD